MKNFAISFLVIFAIPLMVFSQEVEDSTADPNSEEGVEIIDGDVQDSGWSVPGASNEDVNCFDYYTFQSVNVSVSPDKDLFQPGEKVRFSGMITNDNPYPVVDGNLFVRISKYNENFMQEGHYVVDEFFALEGVVLNQNSSKEVSFEWEVPIEMSRGDYHVDYFFSVGKKFNLGGLPFSNEIIAGISSFEIDSINAGYFSFERAETMINDEKYQHIGSWPIVKKNSDVVVTHRLVNTLNYNVGAVVTFDLYFWDSLLKEDRITSKEVFVVVPAGGSENVSHAISNAEESVYYLKTTAKQGSLQTIVNARFTTEGGEHARLNYPAITKFPVKKGDEFTLFSCFHNTTYTGTEGSVSVSLFDENGGVVAQSSYEGGISSAMSAIKEDVKAEKDYEYLKLHADIKNQSGEVVDVYEAEYTCEDIGQCSQEGAVAKVMPENPIVQKLVYAAILIIFVLVVLMIAKVVKNQRGSVRMILIIFAAICFFGTSNCVDAGTWYGNSSKSYTHGSTKSGIGSIFHYNIASGNVTLQNSISGSDSLTCGGSVTYTYNPRLAFSASGGSWDTPYGAICNSLNCIGSSQTQNITDTSGRNRPGRIRWMSQRPNVTLSSSNDSIVKCSGMTCTAQPGKSGTVNITANFSGVTSQIYSSIMMKPCHKVGTSCPGCRSTPSRYNFWHSPSNGGYGVTSGCIKTGYHSIMHYDGSWRSGTNRMSLGASSASWPVTVSSCSVNGACNSRSARNNYPYTATSPATPLCNAGTAPTSIPKFSGYGAASEVTWVCSGVGSGTNSPTCRAQRMAPPQCECNLEINERVYSYLVSSWPASLCSEGSVIGSIPGFPAMGSGASWQCGGTACSNGPVDCSASRSNPPDCRCGIAAGNVQSSMPVGPGACAIGDQVASSNSGGVYSWRCGTAYSADGPFGRCIGQATCAADCFEVDLDVPSSVYLNDDDEGKFKARIRIGEPQNIASGTCDITVGGSTQTVTVTRGQEYTPYTDNDFTYVGGGTTVSAECRLDVDCGTVGSSSTRIIKLNRSVQSVCAERSCNSQGSCQSTPRGGVTSNSECSSTCVSNSDCTKGRIIETRP